MALPAGAALLFGIKGVRAGRNLLSAGKGIFKRLHPEAKPMKIKKPANKQIKTAKPTMIKPKISPATEAEKKMVLGEYYGLDKFKPGSSLKPKGNLTPKLKPSAKGKATKLGKKFDAKGPGSVMFNAQGALKKELSDIKY